MLRMTNIFLNYNNFHDKYSLEIIISNQINISYKVRTILLHPLSDLSRRVQINVSVGKKAFRSTRDRWLISVHRCTTTGHHKETMGYTSQIEKFDMDHNIHNIHGVLLWYIMWTWSPSPILLFRMPQSLWNVTSTSAPVLPRRLSNCTAITLDDIEGSVWHALLHNIRASGRHWAVQVVDKKYSTNWPGNGTRHTVPSWVAFVPYINITHEIGNEPQSGRGMQHGRTEGRTVWNQLCSAGGGGVWGV